MKNWVSNHVVWLGIAIIATTVIAACSLFLAGKTTEAVAILVWVVIFYMLLRRATCKQQNGADSPQDETPDSQPR